MSMKKLVYLLSLAALVGGCGTDYVWRSNVPQNRRTVAVPTFRNATSIMEIGAVMARQVRREFQREGTFKLADGENAAIEIQGEVKTIASGTSAYDRRSNMRHAAYDCSATVIVSVIDRQDGNRVIIDNRPIVCTTQFTSGQDITTAERDASGRLAEDFARQLMDILLNLKWENRK